MPLAGNWDLLIWKAMSFLNNILYKETPFGSSEKSFSRNGSIIGVKNNFSIGSQRSTLSSCMSCRRINYQKEVMAMPEFLAQYAKQGGLFVKHEEWNDPDSCNDRDCLVVGPAFAQVGFFIIIRQTDKGPNYRYPIYCFVNHKELLKLLQFKYFIGYYQLVCRRFGKRQCIIKMFNGFCVADTCIQFAQQGMV